MYILLSICYLIPVFKGTQRICNGPTMCRRWSSRSWSQSAPKIARRVSCRSLHRAPSAISSSSNMRKRRGLVKANNTYLNHLSSQAFRACKNFFEFNMFKLPKFYTCCWMCRSKIHLCVIRSTKNLEQRRHSSNVLNMRKYLQDMCIVSLRQMYALVLNPFHNFQFCVFAKYGMFCLFRSANMRITYLLVANQELQSRIGALTGSESCRWTK